MRIAITKNIAKKCASTSHPLYVFCFLDYMNFEIGGGLIIYWIPMII
ncbi:hypothetical protein MTBMA_c11640 [Methanothermobacter marburgensis str. Marburg]|uniref:Uncharacterized protein n=1 Tax=Methanothermobacter marburgensis (strain ATCC BAA-927 / DSM 2133 / JCM 14651 / NBRC 100331 / OCM 82 / Marburg) TaxID=79929 RepID=D9PX10_METTM|nr:hypothetical protein MTBMA_c11640 [Methanothermobacter marburgensis str. Marburg]